MENATRNIEEMMNELYNAHATVKIHNEYY